MHGNSFMLLKFLKALVAHHAFDLLLTFDTLATYIGPTA